jgi:branched-chain amino acid transport system substrate-binding protein
MPRSAGGWVRAAAAALAVSGAGQVLPVVGGLDGLPDVPVVRLARAVQQGASARSRQALAPTRTPRTSRHPLLVGGLYPRGDLVPADGSMMRAGASLAVNQVNAAGGVHGRPVRHLAVEVDVNDAEAIRSGLRTLIDTGVDAVTLGYTLRRSRNDLGALFEQVAEAGIPLLHSQTSGLAPALVAENRHRFRGIFQVCAAETRYGVGFVRTLEELAATGAWRPRSRRIAVVDSRDPDLAVWSEEAHRAATDAGWHVTTRAEVDPLNPAWDAALSALRTGEDPAAILVGCFLPGALADFLHLHAAEPSPALLFATYAPSVPGFLDRAGPAAEGLLWSTVIGTRDGDVSARFVQAFRVASGHGPGRSSAGTHFDMVHLLAEAWARAENPLDRPSVLRNIARATHRGVNGLYAFDPVDLSVRAYPDDTLDPTLGMAHLVFRVRGGRHELISPLPYGARPVGVGRAR